MLTPVVPKPGFFTQATGYAAKERWWKGNRVRFRDGRPRNINGWKAANIVSGSVTGIARGILTWRHFGNATRYCAIGTERGLYIFNGDKITDITPTGYTIGKVDSRIALGYGVGAYGAGKYGTPRAGGSAILDATTWSFDTWGDYLVGCASTDGKLYEWDGSSANATAISNAPTDCRACFVTEERALVAIGTNNPRRIAWSDLENNTVWTASSTNKAGDLDLVDSSRLIAGRRGRGMSFIWSYTAVHGMFYQPGQFVYGTERLGENCGAIGANAMVVIDGIAFWMGRKRFFMYDGAVRELDCDVQDHVYNDINLLQGAKVFAAPNLQYGEIWWHYPSEDSTENDRYVIYNYKENSWYFGELDRTAWADSGIFDTPLALDADGTIYLHETGQDADGAPLGAWIESHPFELGAGHNIMRVKAIVPDFACNKCLAELQGSVALTIFTKEHPQGGESAKGPFIITSSTERAFTAIAARQARLRIASGGGLGDSWSMGTLRFDVEPGGPR